MDNQRPTLLGVLAQIAVVPPLFLTTILGFVWGCLRLAFNDGIRSADRMAAQAILRNEQRYWERKGGVDS